MTNTNPGPPTDSDDPPSERSDTDGYLGSTLPLSRRGFLKASSVGLVGALLWSYLPSATPSSRKTRATFYTDRKRRAARENIDSHDWARARRDGVVSAADKLLDQFSLDDLWEYVGSQHVPRTAWLAEGTAGSYPWSSAWAPKSPASGASYAAKPGAKWKISDREYTLPTNDFEAYRRSGLDESGAFDPSLADRSLLVNEEHPEMGPKWGVDDGLGWVDENGDLGDPGVRWTPVGWAHHWNVIYGMRSMLDNLSHAYLYTEDQRYARAVAVLLDRLADVYPDMSLQETVYFDDGGYTEVNGLPNPTHGGTGQGKQIGSIWESYWVKAVMKAYDAVFPALDVDSELTRFLDRKATEYPSLPAKDTTDAVRSNIESGFIRQMLPGVKRAQIRGNFGSHQQTVALSAVVQDDRDGYTDEALDFLFKAGTLEKEDDGTAFGRWRLTGGEVLSKLLADFDRDGFSNEASVHYNSLVARAFEGTAEVLNGYDGYSGADLYRTPLVSQAFETQSRLTFLNRYVPRIGDTAGTGSPGFDDMIPTATLIRAYVKYGGEGLVKWLYHRNGNSDAGLRGDIFDRNPEQIDSALQTALAATGPLDLESTQLAGYGFTALRAGSAADGTGRGVWTYYGRNAFGPDDGYGTSHCHRDTLNLGVFGHDLNLSPDLGYPEETGDWPKRWHWTANTVSHNTVVVNERQQDRQWVAAPKRFDHTDRVQLFDVDAADVYEETDRYRRTTAQVTIDEANSYAVDFFAVAGGTDHHFSFHGPPTPGDRVTYDLRDGVSEFVARGGAGGIEPSRDAAVDGSWSIRVFDPSDESHDCRGLSVAAGSDAEARVSINAQPTGTEAYWQHVQAIYLGQDERGRHVCAGVGNHGSGDDPRLGLFYPEANTWAASTSIDGWRKGAWYSLTVSTDGTTVDVALESPDGTTRARGTYELPSATDDRVGIFGGLGTRQTGSLYFDGFTVDGTAVELLRTEFEEQSGVSTERLHLTPQDGGTYAGRDVQKPGPGEQTEYDERVGNGFNYLSEVERDPDPGDRFSVEWNALDYWDVRPADADPVRMRLTMLTACDDVAIATGDPPQRWNNPDSLNYLLAHRRPERGSSVFRSVIESYEGERAIADVTAVPVESDDPTARAVQVELNDGRTDYVLCATARPDGEPTQHTVDGVFSCDGAFAVYSVDDAGNHEHAYLVDGSSLTADGERLIDQRPRIEGTVDGFTRSLSLDNELRVSVSNGPLDPGRIESAVGSWVYADAVDGRNGAYEIVGVEDATSAGATLKLGERTTVKQFRDPSNPDAGYEYVLEENGRFVIPLSATWSG
ncbi:heparinase II/III family protein [Haloferax sp. ATB1]|uniref:heparinase II/III domain-containing protein n=1 Tax=Haloferax sp. ATB1 TaxID=1508454 RepID=UPI0005B214CF|nr:heparinase II/III family protein [Haloferax sp. ATB1]